MPAETPLGGAPADSGQYQTLVATLQHLVVALGDIASVIAAWSSGGSLA